MKTIFFGSSDYCLPILDTLYRNLSLKAIITKPDSLVGRKQIITPTGVKNYSVTHNIPVFTPANRKELVFLERNLQAFQPDIAVVADYGLIIPEKIFSMPRLHTLNIHFSKLPDLRGASPVQYAIMRGDVSAWISIILMDEKMDTGDILWQKEVKLNGDETTQDLYKKLFNIAAISLPDVINDYNNKKLTPKKQDHAKATYTKIFSRSDGFIPFLIIKSSLTGQTLKPAELQTWPLYKEIISNFPTVNDQRPTTNQKLLTIHNTSLATHHPSPTTYYPLFITYVNNAIRALSPWPGVWTDIQITKRLKILKAHLEPIIHNTPHIAKLVLDLVQLEGKNPVSWKQFTEGYPDILSPASLITCANSL